MCLLICKTVCAFEKTHEPTLVSFLLAQKDAILKKLEDRRFFLTHNSNVTIHYYPEVTVTRI